MKEEILNKYKYRLELHAHTKPASHCGDIPTEEWVEILAKDGYSGVAFTNHLHLDSIEAHGGKNNYLDFIMNDFKTARALGEKLGIKVYLGAELRFSNESDNDYLLFGIDREIMQRAIESTDYDLETFVNKYKDERSVLIQAHPFRKDMIRMNPDLLDGIEVFNMHPGHNSKIALASKWADEAGKFITCGTDFHHYGHDNICATRAPFLPNDSFDIVKLYNSRDYIIEIGSSIILI